MLFPLGCSLSLIFGFILFFTLKKFNFFKIKKSLLISFFSVVLIGATLMLYFSSGEFEYYSQLKKWPVTSGLVTEKKIVGERAVMPQLKYRYYIDGKQFQGTSDLATPPFGNKKFRDQTARNVLRDFNPGDSIKVHYNPKNMKQSVLKVNPHWDTYMRYGLAIMLQITSISMLLSVIFSKKGNK